MNKEKTICLCAIVKNEEKTMPRLIESCRHIIDYWVIIDTGSTDKTEEVTRKALEGIPGEFEKRPWKNFGHNRTELVQQAKGKADYLLLMDADMVVLPDKKFDKRFLNADMYLLQYSGSIDFSQPLFVSGHKNWHYEGYTHEYITSRDGYNQGRLPTLRVSHLGDGGARADKYERDIRLLTQETQDKPGWGRPWFYLAQTYQYIREFEKSITAYRKRLELGGWQEETFYSLFQIGVNLYNLKQYDSAILQFFEAYNHRPIRFEPLFMLGQIYRERKKYGTARLFFEKIKSMPYPSQDILFIHRAQYDYLTDFELGICYYWLGDFKKSEIHCRAVMNCPNVDPQIKKQNADNYRYTSEKLRLQRSSKNDIKFISFFTGSSPYEEEVKNLKESLERFKLDYEIYEVKPQGSWVKNTQLKPMLIIDAMERFNKDIIWVDADAVIVQNPMWFDRIDCDIAFHTLRIRNEMLTGTVFFKNNPRTKDFLYRWKQLNESNNNPDAVNFQALMSRERFMRIVDMPGDYVKIFDLDMGEGNPVIVHNQASRRFKKEMNTGLSPNNIIFTLLKNRIKGYNECAVIGNGPFKSNLGSEIDRAFVIRCNNFQVKGFHEQIGCLTNVNASSLYHEIIPDKKVPYPIFGVLPLSDTLYQEYTDAKNMHKFWEQNANNLVSIGNSVWTYTDEDDYAKLFTEVASKINAFPTVGIMAIATARKLGFKKIILSGFTFFKSDKSHYFKDEKVRPSTHHNPDAELSLVRHWIENDKIEYVLDDLMKETIFKYETAGRDAIEH